MILLFCSSFIEFVFCLEILVILIIINIFFGKFFNSSLFRYINFFYIYNLIFVVLLIISLVFFLIFCNLIIMPFLVDYTSVLESYILNNFFDRGQVYFKVFGIIVIIFFAAKLTLAPIAV